MRYNNSFNIFCIKILTYIFTICLIIGCGDNKCDLFGDSISNKFIVDILSKENLSKVCIDWPATNRRPSQKGTFEIEHIPQKTDLASDLPRFMLYRDPNIDCFWVMVSGGIDGKHEWKGPLSVNKHGKNKTLLVKKLECVPHLVAYFMRH